jgi:diadenylate cyclase
VVEVRSEELLAALAKVAPGQSLRDGLDRVLQANKGALIIVGDGPEVLNICSGGFLLDAAFSPQRLSELAKMDGAIILAGDASRIARANVHLVPDPNVPTSETGTRHRTAERVARSIDVPVIAVSEGQRAISVYVGEDKHPLSSTSMLLDRANQGLQTLQRYRVRLDRGAAELTTLEVEDVVSLRDIVNHLQLLETMVRISAEVEADIVELGADGRLVALQLEEVMEDVVEQRRLIIRDYVREDDDWTVDDVVAGLMALSTEDVSDDVQVGALLHLPPGEMDLNTALVPRGFRMLSSIPRLPSRVITDIVDAFGNLPKIMRASEDDFVNAVALHPDVALSVKEGLRRVAEASILRQV